VKWLSLPPQREYKSLVYMGRVPQRQILKDKENPFHISRSKNCGRLGLYLDELLRICVTGTSTDFVVVEPSLKNVNKTISSYDDAKFGKFENEFLDYGCSFLDNEYRSIFNNPVSNSEEVSYYTDWSKSAGYTATFHGIKSKGELVSDPLYVDSDYARTPIKTIPLMTVANKTELKIKSDVLDNKIRQFFISEYHLFKSQVKFGKRSSLKLKDFKWSAYGFNPFNGGVDRLARKLLSKPIRFFYDVSGWDKFIPLMKHLYDMIYKNSRSWIDEADVDEFIWMIKHTIAFYCVLYDGDIIYKKYGNASGSGTTTRDNILMHVILAAAFLAEAYYFKMGCLPPMRLVAEQICKLFGDDSVFAVDIEFEHVLFRKEHGDGFLNTFFKRFGMKLKFLYGGEDFPIEEMSFLGFTFKKVRDTYLPLYDPKRLATSFIHTNDKSDTLDSYVSKVFVLTLMSYATPQFDLFFKSYLTVISSLTGELTPVANSFRDIVLTPQIIESFYTGAESNFADSSFFESALEVGGRNLEFFPYVNQQRE
jgi:hypothetical protein